MDRLHLMNVFVTVAEEQGFSAAARRLEISPPAVTRAVSSLEERLGVKLLTRTTRYVRLTDAGHNYLHDARRIIAEVDAADESVSGLHATPKGELVVTAPAMYGRLCVMPVVVEYLKKHRHVSVSTVFVDRVVNLLEEGMDVGIRIGELPDSSLRAVNVGSIERVVCASPEYLAQAAALKSPSDLVNHDIVATKAGNNTLSWTFAENEKVESYKLNARLMPNTNDAAIEAALAGFGVTRLLSYQVESYIKSGQLVEVLNEYALPSLPVHIVHQQGRNVPAKVRTFIDLAKDRLRSRDDL